MLVILIDAAALNLLLKIINNYDIDFVTALIVGIVAAFGIWAFFFLGDNFGLVGMVLAGVFAAAGLGIAVSAVFGVEIRRSMLIGNKSRGFGFP